MKSQASEAPYLPLLFGVVAVIMLGISGFAAVMAWMPTSTDMAAVVFVLDKLRTPPARPVIAKTQISPGRAENDVRVRVKCAECGIVESTRKIEQLGGGIDAAAGGGVTWRGRKEIPGKSPNSYEVTVRMRNGSRRVFVDAHSVNWRAGERVILIEGADLPNDSGRRRPAWAL